ncbi:hypothetical protein BRC68_17715 [Halobacteriales archaeon QH_6_64_20]|nr:MAG: hypothetical protein BRC68_17715 [Halobacteriales archaeon QH_6_64_20]
MSSNRGPTRHASFDGPIRVQADVQPFLTTGYSGRTSSDAIAPFGPSTGDLAGLTRRRTATRSLLEAIR